MKKISFLFALLCASVMSFAAIDWSQYEYLGDGAGGGAYSNKYKVAPAEGQNVVNIQKPGWAAEAGIYTSDFGGAIQSCSLGDKCAIDGGGVVLYLSAFTAKETEVTIVAALGTKTFTVYYEDGTEGGGSGEPSKIYDTNFALASNGSSATASSGNAALAIDGNEGTRWESAATDDETWTLNMGQARIFNTIKILWEGAYAKEFELTYSMDGETWNTLYTETNLTKAGWQTIEVEETTAQYIQYHGTKRATGWGQSFFEFQVLLPGVSTLTTIELSAASTISKTGSDGVALTASPKDQNGKPMEAEISYEITPAAAGNVVNGKYVAAQTGAASIVAYNGEVRSNAVTIYGVASDNLALSTNITTDNKIVAQSAFGPDGTDAFYAVDGNQGSVYQGRASNSAGVDFDAWFVVDLGAYYNIDMVTINFEGACAQNYHVDFSGDNTEWLLGYDFVGTPGIYGRTDYISTLINNQKVRYVRFWSTKAATEWGMKIFEFQVFGQEWVDSGDTEAPVMVSATLVSKNHNTAVIAVEATDNHEIASYRVTSTDLDKKIAAVDGKITVTGLTPNTAYTLTVTAFDAAGNESANNKSVAFTTDNYMTAPTAAAEAPTWDASLVKAIYSPTYNANCGFGEWGSGTTVTDTEFGKKYVTVGGGYFGMVDFAINALTMEKLHFDIWIADDATIRIVPIWGGAEQGVTVTLKGQQWNCVDVALDQYTGITDWSNIYQMKIDQASNLTFWVGNAYFYRESELVDDEKPTNVTAAKASESYFSVVLTVSAEDNSGAVLYVVKDGETEVGSGAGASGANVNITINNLTPNTEYNFHVIAKDGNDNAAEPVAVSVKTKEAPASAPVPTFANMEKVVPVFTDAQAGGPAIAFGEWGQTTAGMFAELAANDQVCYGSNFNYMGWLLTPAVNATDMQYLHVDFYSATLDKISVTPISPGHEGVKVIELTKNQWNCVEIDLSAYEGKEIDWSNIFQFKFFDAAPTGGDLFIDNVFFYTPKTTAVENVQGDKIQSRKVIENGVLYIIRDGVRYNVMGARQ